MRINDRLKNLLNRARLPRSLESVKFGDLLADIAENAMIGVEGVMTDIQRATDNFFVNTAEVASTLKDVCTGTADVQGYSNYPRRIGTWIDGKPVWRVGISETLSQSVLSAAQYEITETKLGVTILDEVNIILRSEFGQYDEYNDATLRVPCGLDTGFAVKLNSETLDRLVGYIEFVTPESNIKTGDNA